MRNDLKVEIVTNYFRAFCFLRSMMKSAYWDYDRLTNHQNKKLRNIMRCAYDNVPFYHRKFRKSGIRPSDIKTTKDLKKLPIIRKNEVGKNLAKMISKKYDFHNLKVLSTSGSTGKPLFLRISGVEDEFRKAKHLRANISCGQKLRDRWVVITSPHHFGASTKLQRMLGLYVPTPVSVFNNVATQMSIIGKMNPDILDGYSSSLLLLAKEAEKRRLKTIKPRFVIGGAELIDDVSRGSIEDAFDAPFYDQYSCIELDRVSWQCPEKIGYHMDAESIIVQFIDENGEEVSPGEKGEIVCTSLFNCAMPLIRYAIGDMGSQSNDECPCGRTLPLMKVIEGRRDSLLVFPNGRVLSPRTFTVAVSSFKFYKHIDLFRIVQKKDDSFEIYIKMKEDGVDRNTFEQVLVKHLRGMLGLGTDLAAFKVKFVEDIPLDKSGKLMIVVSELYKQ